MTSLSYSEKHGITDFFNCFREEGLAELLAKVICKNLLEPQLFDGK